MRLALRSWISAVVIASCWCSPRVLEVRAQSRGLRVVRARTNPIIRPEMLPGTDGENINGPSLIRAPGWLAKPLGRYYLYFAHHNGLYIRLAYANDPLGPYTIHKPGTLHLEQARACQGHVASPDVHVDDATREIRMYFHCPTKGGGGANQATFVATSVDGLNFAPRQEVLGAAYFRVFHWREYYYALGMPGILFRSRDGLSAFEKGPTLFSNNMRHSAVTLSGDELSVFYTNVGDEPPEQILLTTIRLTPDWLKWKEGPSISVLKPELDHEGGRLPLAHSARGAATRKLRELRDPAIYQEKGKSYLLYSVAAESGIAIAELLK